MYDGVGVKLLIRKHVVGSIVENEQMPRAVKSLHGSLASKLEKDVPRF